MEEEPERTKALLLSLESLIGIPDLLQGALPTPFIEEVKLASEASRFARGASGNPAGRWSKGMHLDLRCQRALTGSVWHTAYLVLSAFVPLFGAGEMRHGAMMARLGSFRTPSPGASAWSPVI